MNSRAITNHHTQLAVIRARNASHTHSMLYIICTCHNVDNPQDLP